jgi:hypothetical protein
MVPWCEENLSGRADVSRAVQLLIKARGRCDMTDIPSFDEDMWTQALKDTADPEVRMRLMSYRMSVLTREKEAMERRLAKLELAFTMGKGVFWFAPILLAVAGWLVYNWGWISRPWNGRAS